MKYQPPQPQSYSAETAALITRLKDRIKQLEDRIKRLDEALSRIANQDYRGNRSTESQIAFDALKEVK